MQHNMKNQSEQPGIWSTPDVFEYFTHVPTYFSLRHSCNSAWTSNIGNSESHPFCEITIYLQPAKCLFVNDIMYISQKPCFFTFHPGECHYAIHSSPGRHERYTMELYHDSFFSLPGGHDLLRCLFAREAGEHNMIVLPEEDNREAFRLLDCILSLNNSNRPERQSLQLSYMIQFLSILNQHYLSDTTQNAGEMSDLLRQILAYIASNLTKPLQVADLAQQFSISQSSLVRMFRNSLDLSPKEYIIRCRMESAREFLCQGQSVTDACSHAGFGDYSRFIADFRRFYGITPAKYGRQHQRDVGEN